jgi:prephenate dehydrogenase
VKRKNPKTIAIIGLGLIGGSIGLACRKHFSGSRVVGISRSRRKIQYAKRKQIIHDGTTRLEKGLTSADLIIICTPVGTIQKVACKVEQVLTRPTVVTDVGSTKHELVRQIELEGFKKVMFVGAHPLAGSHLAGVEHAGESLFRNAFVFLTPTEKTLAVAQNMVRNFWNQLGAKVKMMSPKKHDQIASEISHTPHAIAACLVASTSSASLRFSSTGFADTTRVAQGDPDLWIPIFLSNRKNLISSLSRFSVKLLRFTQILERGSRSELARSLKCASQRRKQLRSHRDRGLFR